MMTGVYSQESTRTWFGCMCSVWALSAFLVVWSFKAPPLGLRWPAWAMNSGVAVKYCDSVWGLEGEAKI